MRLDSWPHIDCISAQVINYNYVSTICVWRTHTPRLLINDDC